MPLSEEQIVRFSRQILLTEVGGAGQLKLLGSGARVAGRGPAPWTAAAYVAAGGSPVDPNGALPARVDELGFWADGPTGGTLITSIVGPGAAVPSTGAVAIIAEEHVVFGGAGTCRACLDRSRADSAKRPRPEDADLLGAVAALAHQRFALGSSDAGVLRITADGGLAREPLARCPRCA